MPFRRRPARRLTGVLGSALLAIAASPAPAASQDTPKSARSVDPDSVVENRSLGCSLVMPEDGQAAIAGGDDVQLIRVVQKDANPPAWEILIRPMRMPEDAGGFGASETPSPEAMMAFYLKGPARRTNS